VLVVAFVLFFAFRRFSFRTFGIRESSFTWSCIIAIWLDGRNSASEASALFKQVPTDF